MIDAEIQLDELMKTTHSVNFLRFLALLKILFSRQVISEQDVKEVLSA